MLCSYAYGSLGNASHQSLLTTHLRGESEDCYAKGRSHHSTSQPRRNQERIYIKSDARCVWRGEVKAKPGKSDMRRRPVPHLGNGRTPQLRRKAYYRSVARRNMIVIGGSAGSVEALKTVVRNLPTDLPAAIFVVVHTRAREYSALAQVLNFSGRIKAIDATDGQRIENGMIYVAPTDRHMLIANDHIHLSRGPKEGLHRPSINATFRTAAACCDGHVVGVLLSGLLDDGASGLWEIVQNHGLSIVQDPAEAKFPSMPMSALESVPINFRLKAEEIGPQLVKIVNASQREPNHAREEPTVNEIPRERFSGFTCPECRGPLYERRKKPTEFVCRVGHIFPLATLLEESTSTQEKALYQAIVSLEEGADMAEYAACEANDGERKQLLAEAKQLRRHSAAVRQLVEERKTPAVSE